MALSIQLRMKSILARLPHKEKGISSTSHVQNTTVVFPNQTSESRPSSWSMSSPLSYSKTSRDRSRRSSLNIPRKLKQSLDFGSRRHSMNISDSISEAEEESEGEGDGHPLPICNVLRDPDEVEESMISESSLELMFQIRHQQDQILPANGRSMSPNLISLKPFYHTSSSSKFNSKQSQIQKPTIGPLRPPVDLEVVDGLNEEKNTRKLFAIRRIVDPGEEDRTLAPALQKSNPGFKIPQEYNRAIASSNFKDSEFYDTSRTDEDHEDTSDGTSTVVTTPGMSFERGRLANQSMGSSSSSEFENADGPSKAELSYESSPFPPLLQFHGLPQSSIPPITTGMLRSTKISLPKIFEEESEDGTKKIRKLRKRVSFENLKMIFDDQSSGTTPKNGIKKESRRMSVETF